MLTQVPCLTLPTENGLISQTLVLSGHRREEALVAQRAGKPRTRGAQPPGQSLGAGIYSPTPDRPAGREKTALNCLRELVRQSIE